MPRSLENIKNEYADRVNAILGKLGIDYARSELSTLNPFDVAFEFFNASPRLGADSLKGSLVDIGAMTKEAAPLPEFLSATKITGNSALKNWYLRLTEPLINDRIFILLSNHENDTKEKLSKAKKTEEKNELAKKLAEIKAEKNAYMEYMDKYRVTLLEETRNDFIDQLIKQAEGDEETQQKLRKLKAISLNTPSGEEGSLQSRADCLDSYGLHKDILNELEKNSNISKEKLGVLRNLCNHHNDAAYLKPHTYTKLEIFFAALKAIVPIVGLVLLILGMVGLLPSFGASSPMLAVGVGLVLSPAVIEGIGHAIRAGFRKRAPDTAKMIMMAVSIVIGTLGFVVAAFGPSIAALIESPALIKLTKELVAASALIPSAIVRQLFIEKRQTFKDFAFNFFTISSTMWNFMAKVIVTTFGKHKAETTAPVSVVDNKAETTGPVSIVENKNDATTVAVQPKNRSGIAARKSAIVKDFLDVNLLLEGVKIFINLVKAAIGHPRIPKIEVRLFSKWPRNKEPEKTKAIMPAEETPSTNKANENKTAPETTESKVPKVSLPKAKTH